MIMNMNDVLTAISTCGFPIIMALVEAYYIASRTDKMTEVLSNNTTVLNKLAVILDNAEEVDL